MVVAPAAALLPVPLRSPAMASALALLLAAAAAFAFVPGVASEPTQDKQALLAFFSQTHHASRLRWNASVSPCTWVGVGCDPSGSYVYSLRLPGVGLSGPIPPATLSRLTRLRVLSLRSNRLSGDLPSDFSNLTFLRNLYLQGNAFSGTFPPALTQLTRLVRLDLSSNNFSGPIPFVVNNLTRLTGLFLQNNGFSGVLPSINTDGVLEAFNVSSNSLNGSIPASLTKFPASSFVGNLQLCGGPLPPCSQSFFPSPAPSPSIVQNPPIPVQKKNPKKLRTGLIIAIAVGAAVAGLLLLMFLIVWLRRSTGEQPTMAQPKPRGGVVMGRTQESVTTSSSKEDVRGLGGSSGSTEVTNRIVFMESGREGAFDLEELLRASAEVLGKGSVGTSYKAMLEAGRTVVVKRLKDVAAGKEEFEAQMEAVAKRNDDDNNNENVAPIRAFYYSPDEKLLVFDYFPAGSLSAHLHGNRSSGRAPLDWDSRLGIAIGAARGLAHLHHSRRLVHGNIKSSNVLLGPDQMAKVSEYGLNPLFSSANASTRVAGYRAPEVVDNRKVSFKSDVYSFGVLLLELLTGKSPDQALLGDEGIDLPRWVQSVVREEWTAEVFDVELMRSQSHSMNEEEMMVRLLQIAMSCVAMLPDQRPNMAEIVRMMEDMNQNQGETTDDGGLRQSSDDPSKGSEGQTPTTTESRTPPTEGREGITP